MERSKVRAQEQQRRKNQRKNSCFLEERERVRGERSPGGMGPTQEGVWRGQELGHATWPSGLVVAPLVSQRCPLMAFYLKTLNIIFLEFSGQLHCREFFKVQKAAKNFRELETKVRTSEVSNTKLGYSKENKS